MGFRPLRTVLLTLILSGGTAAQAGDWTDAESSLIRDQEQRIGERIDNFEYYCGVKPEWSVDWESARALVAEASQSSSTAGFYGQCLRPLDKIREICGEGGKDFVAEQLSTFTCSFGAPKGKPVLELKDKTLTFSAAFEDDVYDKVHRIGEQIRVGEYDWFEAQVIKDQEQRIGERMETFAYYCGVEPAWSVDWQSVRKELTEASKSTSTAGFYSECLRPIDKLREICGDGGKEAVSAQMNAFSCSFDAPQGDPSVSLIDKKLAFKTSPGQNVVTLMDTELLELIRIGPYSWTEQKYIEHEDEQLEMSSSSAETACGFRIPTRVDWTSFTPVFPNLMPRYYGVAGLCDDFRYRLEEACRSARKDQVRKLMDKANDVVCRFQEGTKETKVALTDEGFVVTTAFDAATYGPIDSYLVTQGVLEKKPPMREISREELMKIFAVDPETRCRQRCQTGCRTVGAINSCRKACVEKCR